MGIGTQRPLIVCGVMVTSLLYFDQSFASIIEGTGTVSGVFAINVATVGVPQRVPYPLEPEDIGIGPVSTGGGTNHYRWGLAALGQLEAERWFLDGVEVPLSDIFVAFGTIPFDQWDQHIGRDYPISNNSLTFNGGQFTNQPKGKTFVAGLLEYHNGESAVGTAVPSVTLTVNSLADKPEFAQTLDLTLNLVTTLNVRDSSGNLLDVQSADFLYFADRPELGSFRVFENESTSVEILAEFNSLDLVGFGKVTDPNVGFVSNSIEAVPEPSSFTVFGIGAVICLLCLRGQIHRQTRGSTVAT